MAAKTATIDRANKTIEWTGLTNADTAVGAEWQGGEGYLEVNGTFNSATVLFKFSSANNAGYELDSESVPDGGTFSGPGLVKFDLPYGYIQPTFSGGGGTQNIGIKVTPKRDC